MAKHFGELKAGAAPKVLFLFALAGLYGALGEAAQNDLHPGGRFLPHELTVPERIRSSAEFLPGAKSGDPLRYLLVEHGAARWEWGDREVALSGLAMICRELLDPEVRPGPGHWRALALLLEAREAMGELDRFLGFYQSIDSTILESVPVATQQGVCLAMHRAGQREEAERWLAGVRGEAVWPVFTEPAVAFEDQLAVHRSIGDPQATKAVLLRMPNALDSEGLLSSPQVERHRRLGKLYFASRSMSALGPVLDNATVREVVAQLAKEGNSVWGAVDFALTARSRLESDPSALPHLLAELDADGSEDVNAIGLTLALERLPGATVRSLRSKLGPDPWPRAVSAIVEASRCIAPDLKHARAIAGGVPPDTSWSRAYMAALYRVWLGPTHTYSRDRESILEAGSKLLGDSTWSTRAADAAGAGNSAIFVLLCQ